MPLPSRAKLHNVVKRIFGAAQRPLRQDRLTREQNILQCYNRQNSMKKKLIKNYTTDVSLSRTIAEIQQMLAENGATGWGRRPWPDGAAGFSGLLAQICFAPQ